MKKLKVSLIALPLLMLGTSPAYSAIGSEEKWEVETTIDDFTDDKKVFALVIAKGGIKNGFIAAGCYPSGFELKVSAGEYIGDKSISNNVKYRVDKNTPIETTMKPTSKKFVYINDTSSPFISDIMNGNSTLLIQTTSYDYDTSKAKFTLKGSTNALKTVLDACK